MDIMVLCRARTSRKTEEFLMSNTTKKISKLKKKTTNKQMSCVQGAEGRKCNHIYNHSNCPMMFLIRGFIMLLWGASLGPKLHTTVQIWKKKGPPDLRWCVAFFFLFKQQSSFSNGLISEVCFKEGFQLRNLAVMHRFHSVELAPVLVGQVLP